MAMIRASIEMYYEPNEEDYPECHDILDIIQLDRKQARQNPEIWADMIVENGTIKLKLVSVDPCPPQ